MLTIRAAAFAAGLGSIFIFIAAGGASAQNLAQAAPAAARAGVAAAVSGEVQLAATPGIREVGKDVVSGDPIFLGDKITTGPDGRLQIMLRDETVFTLGPKAALVVDRFVYDPSTNAGKVSATVLQGTFRFVSGKIAAKQPSDMEVKLPVGSIGVRGTSVAGEVTGTQATVVLLGPGPENTGGERIGRILVSGGQGPTATTVEIVRPGFATTIAGANQPPTPPVRMDPVRLAALTAPLAGTAPKPDSGQGSGQGGGQGGQGRGGQQQGQGGQSGQSGQQGQAAQPVSAGASVLRQAGPVATGGLAGIRSIGALVLNTQRVQQVAAGATQGQPRTFVPDGPTTFEQLHQITVSSATISGSGIAMSPERGSGSGSFNYSINVNFQNQSTVTTVSGKFALGATAQTSFGFTNSDSFAGKTGIISDTGGHNLLQGNGANLPAGVSGVLTDNPRNVGGRVAAVVDVKLSLFDGTGSSPTCATSSNCISGGRTLVRP